MKSTHKRFDVSETPPEQQSFRSIFKWGKPDKFKHPSKGFLDVIKQELNLEDDDLKPTQNLGNEKVEADLKSDIPLSIVQRFEKIVTKENIESGIYSRLKYSTGKSMEDILSLRSACIEQTSDLVIHPRHKQDVQQIVMLCHENRIPLHVYGGGSSVTMGLCCPKGGVTLVMSTHMNRMLKFNEMNQTITVEPGMMGPEYEQILNSAPEHLNAEQPFTGGHFPQSFEFSTVGGWVVTLGSGQASSFYGDAYDLVISQEYVTPTGTFKTHDFPATATGPKLNDIMKGSEGCFGVLVAVTMKIFPFQPQNSHCFSFMFPDFEKAVSASRHISQSLSGMPSIMRISDAEETEVAFNMYGLENSVLDKFIRLRGMKPKKRCIMMGQTDGEKGFSKNLLKQVKQICRINQGISLTGYPMQKWRHGRFSDPYMRDSLNDVAVLIDTLEASVTWDHIHGLHKAVRWFIKSRPHTICMTHASHFYAQGTNLYFIFITRMQDLYEFRRFQQGIIQKIAENNGSLSHHHGVGRTLAPFMETHMGEVQMNALRSLKNYFDPHHILNPGGLGL